MPQASPAKISGKLGVKLPLKGDGYPLQVKQGHIVVIAGAENMQRPQGHIGESRTYKCGTLR